MARRSSASGLIGYVLAALNSSALIAPFPLLYVALATHPVSNLLRWHHHKSANPDFGPLPTLRFALSLCAYSSFTAGILSMETDLILLAAGIWFSYTLIEAVVNARLWAGRTLSRVSSTLGVAGSVLLLSYLLAGPWQTKPVRPWPDGELWFLPLASSLLLMASAVSSAALSAGEKATVGVRREGETAATGLRFEVLVAQSSKVCASCGNTSDLKSRRCRHCGAEFPTAPKGQGCPVCGAGVSHMRRMGDRLICTVCFSELRVRRA